MEERIPKLQALVRGFLCRKANMSKRKLALKDKLLYDTESIDDSAENFPILPKVKPSVSQKQLQLTPLIFNKNVQFSSKVLLRKKFDKIPLKKSAQKYKSKKTLKLPPLYTNGLENCPYTSLARKTRTARTKQFKT